MISKRIKLGTKIVYAYQISLQTKNLIVFKGSKGYAMCGYLNLQVANRFKDAAIEVVGVSSIEQALGAKVHSAAPAARKLGVTKGQSLKEALKLIA